MRSFDTSDLSGSWTKVTPLGAATLDPSAIFDSQKRMHVFVTSTGGAVKDFIMVSSGKAHITQLDLDGVVSVSSPKVIVDPMDSRYLDIFVTGSDYARWLNKLNTLSLAASGRVLEADPLVGRYLTT
jgi:hypothetical protein